jgi:hypothetical protein
MRGSTRRRSAHGRTSRREGGRSQGSASANVVDLTRVVEARRRIASGWYDRSDVRKTLVEAVLQEMRSR